MDTEQEAKTLLAMTCELSLNREYIAKELAEEQTLENLFAFGDRLERAYKLLKRKSPKI